MVKYLFQILNSIIYIHLKIEIQDLEIVVHYKLVFSAPYQESQMFLCYSQNWPGPGLLAVLDPGAGCLIKNSRFNTLPSMIIGSLLIVTTLELPT